MPNRYLLSEESAAIMRALAAGRGGYEIEPRRIASPPGSAPAPEPFDCRFAEVSGADHLLCYVPLRVGGYVSCIRLDGEPVHPWQWAGADAWIDLGAVSSDQALVLGFVESSSAPSGFVWRLGLSSLSYIDPAWASLKAPISLVCIAYHGSPSTIFQIHRGGYDLFTMQWRRGGGASQNYGSEIGNSSQTAVVDLDARKLQGGAWTFPAKVNVGADTLQVIQITINGTNYNVLGNRPAV